MPFLLQSDFSKCIFCCYLENLHYTYIALLANFSIIFNLQYMKKHLPWIAGIHVCNTCDDGTPKKY